MKMSKTHLLFVVKLGGSGPGNVNFRMAKNIYVVVSKYEDISETICQFFAKQSQLTKF
jgi:hypothetical protein